MSFKTRSNAVFLDTNAGDLQVQLRIFGAKCVYAAGKELLRLNVLGARHNALVDASAAVAAVTMRSRDPVTKSLINTTVAEFHQAFMTAVLLLPAANGQFGTDIIATFYNIITTDLRNGLTIADKTFIPKADGETVAKSFTRLQSLVNDLTSVESLDKTLNKKVGRMQQQVSCRAGTAFLATANDQYGDDYNDAYENSGQGITPATMAFHATTRCHPVASTLSFFDGEETQVTDPQAFFTALCHLSGAEDAMRKATGESFPPHPCWGCKDIPRFSANQFNHRWMDCPNKNDR